VIIGSLCAFALVATFVNMIAGIVVMVFLSTIAGTTYSWVRNVKISIGLVLMAFFFARVLGMNLPLY
jgi:small-conductance mechanosensitive channel